MEVVETAEEGAVEAVEGEAVEAPARPVVPDVELRLWLWMCPPAWARHR